MKKQTISLFTLIFIFVLTYGIPVGFAQDYTKWDLPEGAIARLGKGKLQSIQYSPDGSRLAVASSIGIWIYDAQTGKELDLITGQRDEVLCVAFSPKGELIAGGSLAEVLIWNVNTGELKKVFREPLSTVLSVAFSPDGKTIAGGSANGSIAGLVYLWDVASGKLKKTLTGHTCREFQVLLSVLMEKRLRLVQEDIRKILRYVYGMLRLEH